MAMPKNVEKQARIAEPTLRKEEYEAASGWKDIKRHFEERGTRLTSNRLYKRAKLEWWILNRKPAISQITAGLPETQVDIGKVTYHIHGIDHSEEAMKGVGGYIHDELRKYVESGSLVLVEEGIVKRLFDATMVAGDHKFHIAYIDFHILTMDDSRWAQSTSPTLFSEAERKVERVNWTEPEVYPPEVTSEICGVYDRAAHDKSLLATMQNVAIATSLPEPLEKEWLKERDPVMALMHCGRSQRMAEFAIENTNNATHVRMVVGAGHQPGIPYYLQLRK